MNAGISAPGGEGGRVGRDNGPAAAAGIGSGEPAITSGSPADIFRWLRAHWFRLAIAAFALAATLVEWSVIPPIYPLNFLFSGLSVVGILLSPFLPRISGWLIIVTVVARLFVLDLSGPNPLWAAYLALAIIGYDSAIPVAVAALLTVALAECIPVALNTFNALSATWIGMVNYIGMFTLATMGGMSFRWRRQRDEIREQAMVLERRQWQLDTLQRNTRLASRIHDSASGGLSYIALTAQRQLRRIGNDAEHQAERQDWQFVNDQALAVLDEIHHVIDLLEQPERTRQSAPRVGRHQDAIDTAIRDARAKLGQLGFAGTIESRGEMPQDYADESIEAAANLLGEIAANITRHMGPAQGEYRCVITYGDGAIEIMETNPIMPANRSAGLKPHGSGLMMHRRIITRLGGELNTSAEDGDWVLYARIPAGTGTVRPKSGRAS
ncbi:hypothetical protein [Bifidobacterium callitrichidarum]|uniref:histidine kinase n=1 Tax=Bifidobacterium callitrichidarum TaxID=2052941 RepID=A0A2U2NAW7_9BIFI|nr:hypothetical protein [Bifidobacterium callitrichidarum]PWG66253.1 hypothetical protein DF196_04490 [Bifidobacterium callitrichidarum]